MLHHLLAGALLVIRGQVRIRWGQCTHNDLLVQAGRHDVLRGRVRRRYGDRHARVEQQIDAYARRRAARRAQWRAHRPLAHTA